jgi:hypothetical protein
MLSLSPSFCNGEIVDHGPKGGHAVKGSTKIFPNLTLVAISVLCFAKFAHSRSLDQSSGAIEINDTAVASESNSRNTPRDAARNANGGPPGFQPKVGRNAAAKYMGVGSESDEGNLPDRKTASSSSDHYLALHIGTFMGDQSYNWGSQSSATEIGEMNLGFTYRLGEWVNSSDLALRFDYTTYKLTDGRASKLSFVPIFMIPDSNSRFPFYFGGGLGAGIFANQIPEESSIALDYQLFAGLRFFDLGFFIEAGIKSHVFLFSVGQFNGNYVAAGSVFTF